MKANLQLAIKETLLSVKSHIQFQREIIQARRSISGFKLLTNQYGSYYGKTIYIDDEMVLAVTGSRSNTPNAITTPNGVIIINTAASQMSKELTEALILHEVGHVHLAHSAIPGLYQIQSTLGFGHGLNIEYEADEYALSRGAKILELLLHLQKTTVDNRALRLRIERLKKLYEDIR